MLHLKQCLGVDLGFNTVKIVELALDKDSVKILRAESAPTGASPAMSDEEIRQAIVSTTKELIKKGRFSSRKAIFSISGQKVFIRRFRLPKTSEERLARIIQYEARQQIPFPLDKTILQYQHRDIPGEAEVEILLAAVRSDEVRDFMQIANRTGLTPIAVGVSSFALFGAHQFINLDEKDRKKVFASHGKKAEEAAEGAPAAAGKKKGFDLGSLLKKKKKAEPEPEESPEESPEAEFSEEEDYTYQEVKGYINIGATALDLAIGRGGAGELVPFNRTIPVGGNEMTKAIQRELNVESFNDAERIKTSATQLMSFNFDFEEENQVNQDASMAVTQVTDRMVTEIRRSLDFYITQPDGMAIDSIVLSGGQAQIPGIDSYLEEKLTMPVSVVPLPPEGSALRWPESAGSLSPYMIAIGLGLQGIGLSPIAVDFLPEERKITRDFPYRVTGVMFLLVGGTIVIASQMGGEYAAKYRAKADELNARIQRESQDAQQFQAVQQEHNQVADMFVALDKSMGQRDYWMDILVQVAEVKPPGILMRDWDMFHDGQMTIVAESNQAVDSAEFVSALRNAFEGRLDMEPSVDSINEVPGQGGQRVNRFTIRMKLNDKVNHLKITPTPTATPVTNQPGFGNEFEDRQRPGQQGRRGSNRMF